MKLSAALRFMNHSPEEVLRVTAEAGFDGCGLGWTPDDDPQEWKALASAKRREFGLALDYVHAPFRRVHLLWREGDEATVPVERLHHCLQAASAVEAPIVVMHCYIGFQNLEPIGQIGIDRFGALVQEAEKLGVKIAFENTEGAPYLAALMGAFYREKHVGFCWDTGHEACYSPGEDQLCLYGDRLFCTHLNDNMGCHGPVSPKNDLHLLPFDGLIDWNRVASRLDHVGFDGMMNFELLASSKPGRHENDKYQAMGLEAYAKLAYERACRVAALRKE